MTIYPARRKDDRILCGRPGCGEVLAAVPGDEGPLVLFRSYYEPVDLLAWAAATVWSQQNPHPPEAEPVTVLRIGGYATAKMARGQKPVSRPWHVGKYDSPAEAASGADKVTMIATLEDGTEYEGKPYATPAVAPCPHHHLSRIDNSTLEGVD